MSHVVAESLASVSKANFRVGVPIVVAQYLDCDKGRVVYLGRFPFFVSDEDRGERRNRTVVSGGYDEFFLVLNVLYQVTNKRPRRRFQIRLELCLVRVVEVAHLKYFVADLNS